MGAGPHPAAGGAATLVQGLGKPVCDFPLKPCRHGADAAVGAGRRPGAGGAAAAIPVQGAEPSPRGA